MSRRLFAALVLITCPLSAQAKADVDDPVPTEQNFAAWRDHILPATNELLWETIPWKQSFGEGLREANRQSRPLMFYAMNGHPLGCT